MLYSTSYLTYNNLTSDSDNLQVDRTTWDLQFDISAPQIFFVENFCDQGASMAVIDFGRLQLKNNTEFSVVEDEQNISKASEEEGEFFLLSQGWK